MPPKKQASNENINYYEKLPPHLRSGFSNPDLANTQIKLPARILIIGSSGSGKTVALFSFLDRSPRSFTKIVLCVKSTDEPLYRHLIESTDSEILDTYENGEIPAPEKYRDNRGMGIVIFDDLMALSEKQQLPISDWAIRCRKLGQHGFTFVYISQSYFKIPKTIRLQASYLIIKKLSSNRDLNMILSECSLGVNKAQLHALYKRATQEKWDFLLVDLGAEDERRFRRNFLEIL